MLLKELLSDLKIKNEKGNLNIEVKGIAYDSRQVKPGDLFIAIEGFKTDGHDFISQAVKQGANAVLIEHPIEKNFKIPVVKIEEARKALALISRRFYSYPDKKLKIIGITGTNGKTTTAYLIEKTLAQLGAKAGRVTTHKNKVGQLEKESELTTPQSKDLYKLLAQMVKEGSSYAVVEISAHALTLDRVCGINFDRQILTNITPDHLDFYGDFSSYRRAKAKLFQLNESPSLINADTAYKGKIEKKTKGSVISYGQAPEADFRAHQIEYSLSGASYSLTAPSGEYKIDLKLLGEFNVYNSLAAVSTLSSLNFKLPAIQKAIKKVAPIPGRAEIINQKPLVIIDGAHNLAGADNLRRTVDKLDFKNLFLVLSILEDKDLEGIASHLAPRAQKVIISQNENNRAASVETLAEKVTAYNPHFQTTKDINSALESSFKQADSKDLILVTGSLYTALEAREIIIS